MKKLAVLLAAYDAGQPLTKSDEVIVNAYFTEEVKNAMSGPTNTISDRNIALKALDVVTALVSLAGNKVKETGIKTVELGTQHRFETIKNQISNCNSELDVIAGKLRRKEISQEDHDTAYAEIKSDLEKYTSIIEG